MGFPSWPSRCNSATLLPSPGPRLCASMKTSCAGPSATPEPPKMGSKAGWRTKRIAGQFDQQTNSFEFFVPRFQSIFFSDFSFSIFFWPVCLFFKFLVSFQSPSWAPKDREHLSLGMTGTWSMQYGERVWPPGCNRDHEDEPNSCPRIASWEGSTPENYGIQWRLHPAKMQENLDGIQNPKRKRTRSIISSITIRRADRNLGV